VFAPRPFGAHTELRYGKITVIVVPTPASVCTSILPWCCSTMRLTIASPMPPPSPEVQVVKNGSKMRSLISGAIQDYYEQRMIGFAPIGRDVYCVVFVERCEDVLRIISLRKATRQEVKNYVKHIN
jgi:uncharacterized DUF497 family protein